MKTEYRTLRAFLRSGYKTHKKACADYKRALRMLDAVAGMKKPKVEATPKPGELERLNASFRNILKGSGITESIPFKVNYE